MNWIYVSFTNTDNKVRRCEIWSADADGRVIEKPVSVVVPPMEELRARYAIRNGNKLFASADEANKVIICIEGNQR